MRTDNGNKVRMAILNPYIGTYGGGEKMMGFFCQTLENAYERFSIDILTYDNIENAIEKLNDKFGFNLKRTQIKRVFGGQKDIRTRSLLDDLKLSFITREYDIFVNWFFMSKQLPMAKWNIYMCMFPPKTYEYRKGLHLKNIIKRYIDKGFSDKYNDYIMISKYTGEWMHEYWPRVEEEKINLIYPPVYHDNEEVYTDKQNIIVSVGRFFVGGHNKKQKEMVEFFVENEEAFNGYDYYVIGSITDDTKANEYLEEVKAIAAKSKHVHVMVDASYSDLIEIYKKAKIFWHATGLGIDEKNSPAELEHFGITTVEAMNYSVVPVVINKGGQPEIVNDGINGYTWNNLDECKKKTKTIIDDDELYIQMANRAKATSREYSIESFEEHVISFFESNYEMRIK